MREHNYLVGYKGEGQCVYGRKHEYVELYTLKSARKVAKKITSCGGKYRSVVYKLQEVKNAR